MEKQNPTKENQTEQVLKLKARVTKLEAELAKYQAKEAQKPQIGDTVEVQGLSSWEGWTGKLIAIDEIAGKASIEIYRTKAKVTETHRTALHRVHKVTKKPE